ncbi:hypothetical protein [Vulcanisaeta souniana]|uniref:hypothetical protein n=1 Tax=Vulcanisaeta souniana TaxID=164452 RepID=UPI0006D1B454|nr:hypothetical protein [Vulcanisaeta souniana]
MVYGTPGQMVKLVTAYVYTSGEKVTLSAAVRLVLTQLLPTFFSLINLGLRYPAMVIGLLGMWRITKCSL